MPTTGWLGTSDSQSGLLLNGWSSIAPEFVPLGADLYVTMQADVFARWARRRKVGRAWMEPIQRIEDPVNLISAETVTVDKFENGWRSRPLRRKPLRMQVWGTSQLEPTQIPEDPVNQLRPWWTDFSQPVQPPAWLLPLPWAPFHVLEMAEVDRPEHIEVSWHAPLSRVPPRKRRIHPGQVQIGALEMAEADRFEVVIPEAWHRPMGMPPRRARRIRPAAVQIGILEMAEGDRPEVVFPEAFIRRFDVPPRRKRPPRLPWTIAMAEEYLESLFEIPVWIRLHRQPYVGGY
jgi:hypothetical protein